METKAIITFFICIIAILVLGKIFIIPFKRISKLLINSILGGLLIYVINIIGANFNFHIGLNIFTAIFVGILGVPGSILLIILKLIIH